MRYSGGTRSTGAGSTTLPTGSLYAVASNGGALREAGIFNTTTTAFATKLVRLNSAGTQGGALVEAKHDPDRPAAQCTLFDTHTSTGPTLGDDLGYRAAIGAAIGAGIVWTFGDTGLRISPGTANGVGFIVATSTGQIADWYLVWDE